MSIFNFFKKKESNIETPKYEFQPLTISETTDLHVGDEVTIYDVERDTYTHKVFVKPNYKEGLMSFTSGHTIQLDKARRSDNSFIIVNNGAGTHIRIAKDKSSGNVKGYALNIDRAVCLKPGLNVLGMVNETGYHKIKVDVAGQKIFQDDDTIISIERLSEKGFVKGIKSLQGCFFCYDNDTESDSTTIKPVEKLSKNEVVDVYFTADNFRVVRCWVKESLEEDGRVVLKYVNSEDKIILPQKSLSLKLPYIFCNTNTYRVTA